MKSHARDLPEQLTPETLTAFLAPYDAAGDVVSSLLEDMYGEAVNGTQCELLAQFFDALPLLNADEVAMIGTRYPLHLITLYLVAADYPEMTDVALQAFEATFPRLFEVFAESLSNSPAAWIEYAREAGETTLPSIH